MDHHKDYDQLLELQGAISELTAAIRALPEAMQVEAFLGACAAFLQPLSRECVVDLRRNVRERYPNIGDDSEVMILIDGHLALRGLLDQSSSQGD